MAEKNRRGEEPADDNLDEMFDDAVEDDDTADDDVEPVSRSGGTATRTKPKAGSDDRPAKTKKDSDRVGPFGRIGRFVREVVAELRKVIWPTRKELLTYTSVVIVFMTIMVAIIVGLDYLFAEGVLWVFGNPE